jgi:hypothetical protein
MMHQVANAASADAAYKDIYRLGGAAARFVPSPVSAATIFLHRALLVSPLH